MKINVVYAEGYDFPVDRIDEVGYSSISLKSFSQLAAGGSNG
jgi:hypothetical protein